jgi:hypothetical protein
MRRDHSRGVSQSNLRSVSMLLSSLIPDFQLYSCRSGSSYGLLGGDVRNFLFMVEMLIGLGSRPLLAICWFKGLVSQQ